MSEEQNQERECSIDEADSQGRVDLCCCYAVDSNDQIVDPCWQPVDECCCC